MRYLFFGTPKFAAIVLQKLLDTSYVPAAVVCNPDRPIGRKHVLTPPAVKQMIEESRIKNQESSAINVCQPEKLDASLVSLLASLKPDLAIVAAYAKIIPQEILNIPRLGTIGVHPSLLPKYRGASPIQGALLGGEEETGVTLYLIDEKMDHGPVVSHITYHISQDDAYETLHDKLAEMGGELLVKTLPDFLAGKIKPEPQDETQTTYTKKFKTEDAFVPEDELAKAQSGAHSEIAAAVWRKIRALNPEPGVWTVQDGKRVKLLEARMEGNTLKLVKIQMEGEKSKLVIR